MLILRDGRYETAARSELLDLDLEELVSFVRLHDHTGAVRDYRAALRSRPPG